MIMNIEIENELSQQKKLTARLEATLQCVWVTNYHQRRSKKENLCERIDKDWGKKFQPVLNESTYCSSRGTTSCLGEQFSSASIDDTAGELERSQYNKKKITITYPSVSC